MNITDFLLARIAEDEMRANYYGMALGTTRVLAECAAKRAIVAQEICAACEIEGQPCDHRDASLRVLAAVYKDHPDYQEAWGV